MNAKLLTTLLGFNILLLTACGGVPLAQPEGPTAQATEEILVVQPESPLAPPTATVITEPTKVDAEATVTSAPKQTLSQESEILTDGQIGWLNWSPDGLALSYTKFSDQFLEVPNGFWEKGEIWLYDLTTGDHRLLISDGQAAAWSPDGQKLSVSSINQQAKNYDISVYDFGTQSVTPLDSSSFPFTSWTSNQEVVFIADQDLKIIDVQSGKVINEFGLNGSALSAPERSIDVNSQLTTFDEQGRLVRIKPSTGETETTASQTKFDWIAVSPSGQDLAYVTQDIPPAFGILNLETGENRFLLQAGTGDFTNPRMFNPVWSPDGRSVVVTASKTTGTNVPTDVYLFDAATGHIMEAPLIEDIDATSLVWSPDGKQLAFSRSIASESGVQTSIFIGELQ